MIEIKRRWDGVVLYTAENATDVRQAIRDAVTAGADLRSADLRSANLSGADLRSAYLSGADLSGAKGVNAKQHNELRILLDQPGHVRAYKLVNADGWSPIQTTGRIQYEIGKTYTIADANEDDAVQCGAGINLATLPWCVKQWTDGRRILIAEFTAKDIAAIPMGDGKFRVRKAKIVAEVDLVDLGLVGSAETAKVAA